MNYPKLSANWTEYYVCSVSSFDWLHFALTSKIIIIIPLFYLLLRKWKAFLQTMFRVWNNNLLLVQELFIKTLAQPQCRRSIIFPPGLCESAYIPLHFTLQQEDKEHLNRSCSAAAIPPNNNSTALADSTSRCSFKACVKTENSCQQKQAKIRLPMYFYSCEIWCIECL